MKIVNLTPHTINIVEGNNEIMSIPSTGIARAEEIRSEPIVLPGGIPTFIQEFGNVTGLPGRTEDTIFVVSHIVCHALHWRTDLYFPTNIVRDDAGRIIGCEALAQVP